MLALSDTEMLACKVLLAAAHCRIPVEDMRREMRCERIPEQTWRPLWEILGLMVLVDDHDSEFVTRKMWSRSFRAPSLRAATRLGRITRRAPPRCTSASVPMTDAQRNICAQNSEETA